MSSSEPVIAGYTVTAILTAVVNLLVVFGVWTPSAEQIAAVTTVVVIVASVAAALITRRAVTPVAKPSP